VSIRGLLGQGKRLFVWLVALVLAVVAWRLAVSGSLA
jgi:hypothetical protein